MKASNYYGIAKHHSITVIVSTSKGEVRKILQYIKLRFKQEHKIEFNAKGRNINKFNANGKNITEDRKQHHFGIKTKRRKNSKQCPFWIQRIRMYVMINIIL